MAWYFACHSISAVLRFDLFQGRKCTLTHMCFKTSSAFLERNLSVLETCLCGLISKSSLQSRPGVDNLRLRSRVRLFSFSKVALSGYKKNLELHLIIITIRLVTPMLLWSRMKNKTLLAFCGGSAAISAGRWSSKAILHKKLPTLA